MKDSRVTVWTNPTSHLTGSTTNTGPTVDLEASGALQGGTRDYSSQYGLAVEILQTQVTGTAQVTVWEFEVSSDDSTWRKGGYIGSITNDTDDQSTQILKASLQTRYRYFRLLATNTDTGTSTSNVYTEDYGGFHGTIAVANA